MYAKALQLVFSRPVLWFLPAYMILSGEAGATQVHPPEEGLVAHQLGHVVFIVSMGVLIYWLRERKLTRHPGWRYIQYSALFFVLWNADAIVVHYLDGRKDLFEVIDAGRWHRWIQTASEPDWYTLLYYLGKMDHLLCLPAMIFLYLGLRRLAMEGEAGAWGRQP
jgi:hypothetical protein